MSTVGFICNISFLILIFMLTKRKKELQQIVKMRIIKKNGDVKMQELAKRFIGMDVYMKTVGGEAEAGILKEVADNAAVLENNGKTRVVNLDYVVRLMEYPKNKNGKRKQIVVD